MAISSIHNIQRFSLLHEFFDILPEFRPNVWPRALCQQSQVWAESLVSQDDVFISIKSPDPGL